MNFIAANLHIISHTHALRPTETENRLSKGHAEDGKSQNGSNYQGYCIFLISLYRAIPFAVSRYFCLG